MVKSVMANVIKMVKIKVKAAEHLLEFTLFTFFLVKQNNTKYGMKKQLKGGQCM